MRHDRDIVVGAVGEATAYRVVQEALTNVARHSPGRWAEVRLTAVDGGLAVTVDSAPVPAGGAAAGPGETDAQGDNAGRPQFVSLLHRLSLLGGRFQATASERCFRQEAWLPAEMAPTTGPRP